MRKSGISFLLAAALVITSLPADSQASAAAANNMFQSEDAKTTVDTATRKGDAVSASGDFGGTHGELEAETPDTLHWSLEDGVLTISTLDNVDTSQLKGKDPGVMPDWSTQTYTNVPWFEYRDSIEKIVFTGGIKSVGKYTFYSASSKSGYPNLTEVDLRRASQLTEVKECAFAGAIINSSISTYTSKLSKVQGIGQLTTIGSNAFRKTSLSGTLELPAIETLGGGFAATKITKVVMPELQTITGGDIFYLCESLESVEMPKLETITGSNTFRKCTALKSISLPKLTNSNSTFYECSNLSEVSLPELTSTGSNTFSGCSSLQSISLPNLVTVGSSTFSNCTSLESVDLPGITEIGGNGFSKCSKLKTIELDTVQKVGASAFQGCSSLEKVSLPALTEIGNQAFSDCYSLYDVDFSDECKLKSVTMGIFTNCWQLKSLQLADKTNWTFTTSAKGILENLPNMVWAELSANMSAAMNGMSNAGPFVGDYSLKRLYLHAAPSGEVHPFTFKLDSTAATSVSGCTVYVVKAGKDEKGYKDLAGSPSDTMQTVPDDIDDAENAFYKFTQITPGNKVVLVEDEAELEKLIEKENVLRISQEDYYDIDAKEPKVVYNKAGDEAGEITYYYYKQVLSGSGNSPTAKWELVDEENPSKMPTKPGEYWVRAETQDTDNWFGTSSNYAPFQVYGETVSEDGTWGYHNVTHTLTIHDKSILEKGFASEEEPGNAEKAEIPWKNYLKEITSVVVMDSDTETTVSKIGDYAFYGLENVETLPLSDTLEVGRSALEGCKKWKSDGNYTITALGENAFSGCRALKAVLEVNDGVKEIPANAFYYCENVTTISVPDSVQKFGERCFYLCSKLTEINIPDGVEVLPEYFAAQTPALKQIEIPDSVVAIRDYAFFVSGITSITLPKNLGSKYQPAAAAGTSGSAVEEMLPLGDNVFDSTQITELELPASLTVLGCNTLKDIAKLKQIIIPKTVKQILGDPNHSESMGGLFAGCKALEKVVFENTEYTKETLGTTGATKSVTIDGVKQDLVVDGMFYNTSETLQVICDGTTYDVLKEYAATKYYGNYGWTSDKVLYRPSDLAVEWEEEVKTVGEMDENEYEAELWQAMQTALQEAKALIESSKESGLMDQVTAYNDAMTKLREAARQILVATYRKTLTITQEDYYYDDDDDSVDAWYEYLEAVEMALTTINEGTTDKVSRYLEDERYLRECIVKLKPVAQYQAKAELDSLLEEASGLNSEEYTEESWNALQDAIAAAEEVMTSGTAEEIAAAKQKVQEAIDALVAKSSDEEPGGQQTAAPGGEATDTPGGQQTAAPEGTPSIQPSGSPDVQNTAAPTKKPSSSSKTTKVTVKKVTVKKVSSKKKKTLTVQWKKVSGATGYQVVIGLDKKMKKGKKTVNIKKAKTLKTTIKKLKSKKKYFVKVRAYKTVKGKKHYGSWSKVKTVKVK